jgi:membrane fusion protein, heavy metal efflux system
MLLTIRIPSITADGPHPLPLSQRERGVVIGIITYRPLFAVLLLIGVAVFAVGCRRSEATKPAAAEHHEHEGEACDSHAEEAKAEKPDDDHKTEGHDEHDGHDEHSEPKAAADGHRHDEAATVRLSSAAQGNVGVQVAKVERKPFERTITVPAMVIERPGRSRVQIAAPLTGVVTRIYPAQGEAVAPGQAMFDLRLTHEEVVEAQGAFLQTAEELDVVRREIVRLEEVTAAGAVAGKTLLERKYEQQKLEAMLRSGRQRLLLHGLSSRQVDDILANRTLLGKMTVFVPGQKGTTDAGAANVGAGVEVATPASGRGSATAAPTRRTSHDASLLQVEELKVDKGQHVKAGDLLCVLADYSELYIQGKAFEQDMPALDRAVGKDWRVTAVISGGDRQRQTVGDLKIMSLSNTVEPDSRAFLFFVQLPNQLIRQRRTPDGHQFCDWRFKPGQRLELLVPVEHWPDRIVLPRDAVVQDGPESYVFEKNDGHFDRRAVRIEHSDQYWAVLADDGVLKPGSIVVVAGAYQIHLALKNKSGGAPDPHAGHNH